MAMVVMTAPCALQRLQSLLGAAQIVVLQRLTDLG